MLICSNKFQNKFNITLIVLTLTSLLASYLHKPVRISETLTDSDQALSKHFTHTVRGQLTDIAKNALAKVDISTCETTPVRTALSFIRI